MKTVFTPQGLDVVRIGIQVSILLGCDIPILTKHNPSNSC